MNLTVDTNFLVSFTQWDYSVSNRLFIRLALQNSKIFTTKDILEEFSEVLLRDFFYFLTEAQAIIDEVSYFLSIIEPTEIIDVLKEDPDDNKILACAVASLSDYLVTYDKHLLSLKEFRGIKIVKPEELLALL